MDHLPCEILRRIFLGVLPVNDTTRPEDAILSVRAPLYLSHVSRFWREISLSFGELWSHLYLVFDWDDSSWKRNADEAILDTWLSRTNGSPINFWIFLNVFGDYDEVDAERVISTLLSHQQRWKDVVFVWRGVSPSSDFAGVNAIEMPLLSSMYFLYATHRSHINPAPALLDVSRSPHLNSLSLHGQFRLECGNEPIDSLAGPVKLEFDRTRYGSVSEAMCLLKICPNLVAFVVDLANGDGEVPAERHPVTHNLRSLSVTSCPTKNHLIDQLTLPRLESLRFKPTDGGGTLLEFIQRSLPALTLLELDMQTIAEATLISILQLLPSLLHLRLGNIDVSPRIFRELIVTNDTHLSSGVGIPPLCPDLKSFFLTTQVSATCDEAWHRSLVTMAKSRYEVTNTFKRVSYGFRHQYECDVQDLSWNDLEPFDRLSYFHVYGDESPPSPFGPWRKNL